MGTYNTMTGKWYDEGTGAVVPGATPSQYDPTNWFNYNDQFWVNKGGDISYYGIKDAQKIGDSLTGDQAGALRNMFSGEGMGDYKSWLDDARSTFGQAATNNDPNYANYWSQFGDYPLSGTPEDQENWLLRARAGGTAERNRQDRIASDKKTNLIEGLMLASALSLVGATGLGYGPLAGTGTAGTAGAGSGLFDTLSNGLSSLFSSGGSSGPGVLDKLFGVTSGYGSLSGPELAAMIESGTAGAAGASLEGLAGIGAGGGLSGLISSILPSGGSGMTTSSYKFPWGTALSRLIGTIGSRSNAKDLRSLLESGMSRADPAAGERPFYQGKARTLATDPSAFFTDPAIMGVMDAASKRAAANMAAQGYNVSGNQMQAMHDASQAEAFKQYMPFLEQMATYGGLKVGPDSAAALLSKLAPEIFKAQNQTQGNLGTLLEAIFTGVQPSRLDSMRGVPENQNLFELISSLA